MAEMAFEFWDYITRSWDSATPPESLLGDFYWLELSTPFLGDFLTAREFFKIDAD